MICNSCGNENAPNTKFCGKCGECLVTAAVSPAPEADEIPQAPEASEFSGVSPEVEVKLEDNAMLENAPPPTVKAKTVKAKKVSALNPRAKKLLMLAVPAFAIVLIAVIAAVAFLSRSPFPKSDEFFFFDDRGSVIIVYNNGKTADVSGTYLSSQESLDGKRAAFLVNDGGGDYSAHGGRYTLYYSSGSGVPVKVADHVVRYRLSDSGNAIVYYANEQWHGDERHAELYLFDGSTSNRIEGRAPYYPECRVAISPNGKVVFYVGGRSVNNSGVVQMSSYISTNGNRGVLFEHDTVPVAISDGARHIYYVESKSSGEFLCVRRGVKGTSNSLGNVSDIRNIFFNVAYSQIITSESNRSHISINGERSEPFVDSRVTNFLQPRFSQSRTLADNFDGAAAVVFGFDNFRGKVFQSSEGVSLVTRRSGRFDSEVLSRNATSVTQLTDDGKTVVYLSGRTLNAVPVTQKNPESIRIMRDVDSFLLAGSYVYFIDDRNDLHRSPIKDNANAIFVSDKVIPFSLQVSGRGTAFFLRDDGDNTLYFTNNTNASRVANAEDAVIVIAGKNYALYISDMGGGFIDVYRSNGGGRFPRNSIAKNVRMVSW